MFWGFLPLLALLMTTSTAAAKGDDIATITQRLCASLRPQPSDAQRALAQRAAQDSQTLQADGSWPDIDYKDTARSDWKAADHLTRLEEMAKACALSDPPAADLLARTQRALSFWLDHDFQNPNWWWNEIGVPMHIGETTLLIRADLTPDQTAKAVMILRRSKLGMTGANLVWVAQNQIMRGCLTNDASLIAPAFTSLYHEIRVVPPSGEGIQTDWSFHQHGRQLYSGGYGGSFADDCARFTDFAWGTRFQIPPESRQVLVQFLLDGQQWMMRGATFDHSAVGREITRAHTASAPAYTVSAAGAPAAPPPPTALGRLASHPLPRQAELLAFARRASGLPDASPLTGNRAFYDSDYMTQQRPGFLATLHLLSDRMLNGEVVNGEGLKSQFLSYGATFIYRTGNEYDNIFPVWDWRRVPGVTCEQEPGRLDPTQVHVPGRTSFVGGVSDGLDGLAVQDLALGHVTGHKAWFYFDAGFVALGAGLACPTANPLTTSVNQCLRHGDVVVSGQHGPLAPGARELDGTRWVWHDGVGYVFPGGANVRVANQPQTGRWSDLGTGSAAPITEDVFSLWLDHGAHAADRTYAYAVLPGCRPQDMDKIAASLAVVQNTSTVQAVADPHARLLEVAFWAPGHVRAGRDWDVTADQPCLLLVRRRPEGGFRLAVSNPDHTARTVHVTVNGTSFPVELPGGADGGKSVVKISRG